QLGEVSECLPERLSTERFRSGERFRTGRESPGERYLDSGNGGRFAEHPDGRDEQRTVLSGQEEENSAEDLLRRHDATELADGRSHCLNDVRVSIQEQMTKSFAQWRGRELTARTNRAGDGGSHFRARIVKQSGKGGVDLRSPLCLKRTSQSAD